MRRERYRVTSRKRRAQSAEIRLEGEEGVCVWGELVAPHSGDFSGPLARVRVKTFDEARAVLLKTLGDPYAGTRRVEDEG